MNVPNLVVARGEKKGVMETKIEGWIGNISKQAGRHFLDHSSADNNLDSAVHCIHRH